MSEKNFMDEMASEIQAHAGRLRSGKRSTLTTQKDIDLVVHSRYRECNIPVKYWPMEMEMWTRQQDARGNDLTPQQSQQKAYAGQFVKFYIRNLPLLCRGRYCCLEHRDKGRGRDFNSVVLMGGKESGKSMLACIIAKAAARIGEDVRFYEYGDIIDLMDKQSFTMEETQHAFKEEFKAMSLVVVDGVTCEEMRPHTARVLRHLATSRLNVGLPFVLTCGYEVREANEHPWTELLDADSAVCVPLPTSKAKR